MLVKRERTKDGPFALCVRREQAGTRGGAGASVGDSRPPDVGTIRNLKVTCSLVPLYYTKGQRETLFPQSVCRAKRSRFVLDIPATRVTVVELSIYRAVEQLTWEDGTSQVGV